MKKAFIITVAAIICISFSVSPVFAGSKQRHRWEGVAIGVGATLLGLPVLAAHAIPAPHSVEVNFRAPDRRDQCRKPRPRRERGHWETRRIWVRPVCEKVWNPGHYNRRHEWVPGQWITIEKRPGYWTTERYWVSDRRY